MLTENNTCSRTPRLIDAVIMSVDADNNFIGCLCTKGVLEMLEHDGRFLFQEASNGAIRKHKSPLCNKIKQRTEAGAFVPLEAVVSDAAAVGVCKCSSAAPLTTAIDVASIRFGTAAWGEFTDEDEELLVVVFEDKDGEWNGVVHRAECFELEDGKDGECILALLGELDNVAEERECDLIDCECDGEYVDDVSMEDVSDSDIDDSEGDCADFIAPADF